MSPLDSSVRPDIARWGPPLEFAAPAARGRHVGVVLPCFNEEGNIEELYGRLATIFADLPHYRVEFLFIDNASTDDTVVKIEAIIARDPRVKLIINARNFGHIRSPFHGLLESAGDCVIIMCTDLQDPPELIPQFLGEWERGASIVVGSKKTSQESPVFLPCAACITSCRGRCPRCPCSTT